MYYTSGSGNDSKQESSGTRRRRRGSRRIAEREENPPAGNTERSTVLPRGHSALTLHMSNTNNNKKQFSVWWKSAQRSLVLSGTTHQRETCLWQKGPRLHAACSVQELSREEVLHADRGGHVHWGCCWGSIFSIPCCQSSICSAVLCEWATPKWLELHVRSRKAVNTLSWPTGVAFTPH